MTKYTTEQKQAARVILGLSVNDGKRVLPVKYAELDLEALQDRVALMLLHNEDNRKARAATDRVMKKRLESARVAKRKANRRADNAEAQLREVRALVHRLQLTEEPEL